MGYLNGQLLAVLEKGFLLHVIRGQDVLLDALLVLVGAIFVKTLCFFQVEFTIFGSPIRGSDESSIITKLVEGQDG